MTDTSLYMSVHTGTHIDAPSHFIKGGATVDELSLERLMGPTWVVALPGAETIDVELLEQADIPDSVDRLLLKTDNQRRWSADFDPGYAALDLSGARWLLEHGIRLVGIDYLSIQAFEASDRVHVELLEAGVVIVEGLDLSDLCEGPHELICLPLRLEGIEASPARVLARPTQQR